MRPARPASQRAARLIASRCAIFCRMCESRWLTDDRGLGRGGMGRLCRRAGGVAGGGAGGGAPGVVLAEAAAGWEGLRAAVGARALPVFVPPWNRIAPAVLTGLPRLGY